jgi:hypothetical protein
VANEESITMRLGSGALRRAAFEEGSILSSSDLGTEQRYRLQRLRRHLRYLHDWGVVCGLRVVPANDPGRPWSVRVCPGYAVGPYGDEITVPEPVAVDVRDYIWARPDDARAGQGNVAYVGIRYAEHSSRRLPADSLSCGCSETPLRPSRVWDGFTLDVLWVLPESGGSRAFDICARENPPCPTCPESPYVILAALPLPSSEGDPITEAGIDNSFRKTA